MNTLGLPDLTGVYEASNAPGPLGGMILDTTRGAFKVDGGALAAGSTGTAGPDYMDIFRGAVHVLATAYNATDDRTTIYSTAINGTDLSPDPAVTPDEAIISLTPSHLEFLRQDRMFTSDAFTDLFALTSQLRLNFVNATMGAFVRFSPTIQYVQNANPFGMGLLFNAGGIFENDPTVAAAMTTGLSYVGQNTYRANAQTITMFQLLDFVSQPRFNITAGGLLTVTDSVRHFTARGTIAVGATVTGDRICFLADALSTFTGTLTGRNVGFDLSDLVSGVGGASGLRSVLGAGALRFFLDHVGTAVSRIAGTLSLTGAALLDYGTADALGGGAGATLGTIGGSGPTAAGQATWVRIEVAGVTHWFPGWI